MKESVYTEEVVANLSEAYQSAETDEERANTVKGFANQLNVTEPSVRAKLVNLGIYKAKVRASKNGEPVENKARIVSDIARLMSVEEEKVDSLEKANKIVLKMLRNALEKSE